MDDCSSLNQIKLISNNSEVSTELDIELLILNLLSIDKNILYRDDPRLSSDKLTELKELVQRRERGEPLAYLIKSIGFWSLDLYVDENVLVPRPETEIIVEKVLEDFNTTEKRVLDLGTGSGAIGLALSKERAGWDVFCSDKSFKALKIASKNMQSNSLSVSFIHSDWLEAFASDTFDIIICNPPYIDPDDPCVHSDGLKFEPISALISASKGLKDIEIVISKSSERLVNNGSLYLEHGHEQSQEVISLLKKYNFSEIRKFKDLNGDDRVCSGKIKKC
ncbi:peptide chain release factor N(5)-glutamine methyltransferase [Gammaproteobacteria bacterium]|nr:peptide chain release factor N(5)-glutamine methyltransferase [Gammaproteobacteria bacterium]